jgi:hypothetical protein
MAKEFPVSFFYKGAAHTAKVIMQTSDDEVLLCISARDSSLQNILPRDKIMASYNRATGEIKDPKQFEDSADLLRNIVDAVRLHEENKRPVGLWS